MALLSRSILANAPFQTDCRFDELIQLTWTDCQAVDVLLVSTGFLVGFIDMAVVL
jgi:hypothetical protein